MIKNITNKIKNLFSKKYRYFVCADDILISGYDVVLDYDLDNISDFKKSQLDKIIISNAKNVITKRLLDTYNSEKELKDILEKLETYTFRIHKCR